VGIVASNEIAHTFGGIFGTMYGRGGLASAQGHDHRLYDGRKRSG